MRGTSWSLIAIALLAIIVSSAAPAVAREDPPAWLYKMKKVNVRGFNFQRWTSSWVVTGKKKSVVFALDYNENSKTHGIVSYKLSDRGKAPSSATPILSGILIDHSISAIWLGGEASSPGSESDYGLLFVGYLPDADGKKAVYAVAKFDADGQRTTSFRTLMEISAWSNTVIDLLSISATLGPESVAVVLSAWFWESSSSYNGFSASKAYYTETDFNGKPLATAAGPPAVREIKIPGGGRMKTFLSYKPAWNGKRWLIPCRSTKVKKVPAFGGGQTWNLVGDDAMVAVVKGGNSKLKPRKLFGHNSPNAPWAYVLLFLPRESANGSAVGPSGKTGDNMDLFYRFRRLINVADMKLDRHEYSYGIVKISGKGRKVGAETRVDIPKWNHRITYDPKKILTASSESFSRMIVGAKGELIFALTRSLSRGQWQSVPPAVFVYDFDHELRLYSMDRSRGRLKLLALGYPNLNGVIQDNLINWYRGNITILNSVYFPSLGSMYADYFSRF